MSAELIWFMSMIGIDCCLGGILWYLIRSQNRAYDGLGSIFRGQMEAMEKAYESGDTERLQVVQEHARFTMGIARTLLS